MHLSDCPRCGRRELRGARSLHTVTTHRGNVFASTCRGCGAELSASTNRVLRPSTIADVA
jgi:hypothetical protein